MHIPKLLVSVKDAREVNPALQGGAEIIDIKNPSGGSLGMATTATMRDVIDATKKWHERGENFSSKTVTISSALGETIERLEDHSAVKLPVGLSLVKMGTAGLSGFQNWQSIWVETRNRIDLVNDASLRWVAVSYVDWERAQAPMPEDVVAAAVETDCAGVLFDTFQKDERHLLNWLAVEELTRLIAKIHACDLFAACAGKIHQGILEELISCQPDIVAIRSAGCFSGVRESTIDRNAVRQFRNRLERICPTRRHSH